MAKNLFEQADTSKDGKLSIDEVWKFMKKKQLRVSKEQFDALIKVPEKFASN